MLNFVVAKSLNCDMKWLSLKGNKYSPASNCLLFRSHAIKTEMRTLVTDDSKLATKAGKGFSRTYCIWLSHLASLKKHFHHGPYHASCIGFGPLSFFDCLVLVHWVGWSSSDSTWCNNFRVSELGRHGWPFFLWWHLNTLSDCYIMTYELKKLSLAKDEDYCLIWTSCGCIGETSGGVLKDK